MRYNIWIWVRNNPSNIKSKYKLSKKYDGLNNYRFYRGGLSVIHVGV